MMTSSIRSTLALVLAGSTALCGGCASEGMLSEPPGIVQERGQLDQRAYQTRAFDTSDTDKTARIVIATLQDLGFQIDQANPELGVVSGTRLGRRKAMRITVTARSRGADQVLVRATAQTPRGRPATGPQYQEFFNALDKAMFLTSHQVD